MNSGFIMKTSQAMFRLRTPNTVSFRVAANMTFEVRKDEPAISIRANDGRYFEIRIVDNQGIVTSGNLEPDEAARVFMETVGHLILDRMPQGN
jgi:hypothetical protein